jgi:hypothetical protein
MRYRLWFLNRLLLLLLEKAEQMVGVFGLGRRGIEHIRLIIHLVIISQLKL